MINKSKSYFFTSTTQNFQMYHTNYLTLLRSQRCISPWEKEEKKEYSPRTPRHSATYSDIFMGNSGSNSTVSYVYVGSGSSSRDVVNYSVTLFCLEKAVRFFSFVHLYAVIADDHHQGSDRLL